MTLFEMSASGAVLIAIILLLRQGLLNRLPKWTFLLLWGVALCRLLVPFHIPSPLSIYTGASQVVQAIQEEPWEPVLNPPATFPGTLREDVWSPSLPAAPAEPLQESVSPLVLIYAGGGVLCALFFLLAYGRGMRRFREAVPAEQEFLDRWRREHPTLFPVRIKLTEAVNTPLAFGLVRPTVLLPRNTDWADEEQLTYILTHEYVHIRRGDMLWKLMLTAAVCLHWCNPLVWAMYFCANRDLELTCDEAVVGILGLDRRKGYAFALLSAAERGGFPLYASYTSKSHMEGRILAIMSMKKQTLAALLWAVVLVAGVTAVFATSPAPTAEEIAKLPLATRGDLPKNAPSSPSEDRVHPMTGEAAPSSSSAGQISAVPWDYDIVRPGEGEAGSSSETTPAPEERVHPVTGELSEANTPQPG